MFMIAIIMITCVLSSKSSLCDDEYQIENNGEVAISEISFPSMVDVAGTPSSKPEFKNRRLHRDYRVGTSEIYEHNQGRRHRRHTLQVYSKKSAEVVTDRPSDVFLGDEEKSVFDKYEGVFGGHCSDRRGKRVIRN